MITVKRGDTLAFIVNRKNNDGTPLTGETSFLRSQLRNYRNELISEFEISETQTLGSYLFVIPAEITKTFLIETLYFDIEYRDEDVVYSTETETVKVVRDVTRDV